VTVLVTRPAGDCETTVAALKARGIDALAAPVIEIQPVVDASLPADCRALLITSANAVRAIAGRPGLTGIPVYAVGGRTAEAARETGFGEVRSAGGDVADLVGLVRAEIAPGEGLLVHLSGRAVAGDLTGALADKGYDVRRVVVYDAVVADRLADAAVDALKAGTIDAVLLYSPRSAEAFGRIATRTGFAGLLDDLTAVAMSENVAEIARLAGCRHIFVADRPNESALFAALGRFLKNASR
jgi:uroporphyrinogen-III synthase